MFEVNYTLAYDKADDDNERDPFSFRYARADSLGSEYNWSDRDQRHRFNGWLLAKLPYAIYMNNRVSAYSAQPTSRMCAFADSVSRAPTDRICSDGHIFQRNTRRKDNAFFSWDIRLSRPFAVSGGTMEAIVEVFNVTNSDNFRDPSNTARLFNFDGTLRSGLGEPRQVQVGARYIF